MNTLKIVTAVIGEDIKIFLQNLKQVQEGSNFIELRADSIRNIDIEDIQTLKDASIKETILTISNRLVSQGGWYTGTEKHRIKLLNYAAKLGFSYIDIEIPVYGEHHFVLSPETKLILSKHYFDHVPTNDEILSDIELAETFNPTVIKIASIVKTEEDVQNLLKLTINREASEPPRIIIGMGEIGKIIRIIGPFIGSPWTYAATPTNPLTPGHIEFKQLQEIYKTIGWQVQT